MGRFKPGTPKPANSGIKKGQKHRKTRVELACEAAANGRGVDPFLVMADIAADPKHPERFVAAKALSKFLEPEKKAVEITGEMEHGITVNIVDYGNKAK